MKQFIVLLAILPLMLVFLLQFVLDQQTEAKISMINSYVYTAKEYAKQYGYLDCEGLKNRIVEACGVPAEDVSVSSNASGSDSAVTRLSENAVSGSSIDLDSDLIRYDIRVTLEGIMAGGGFFKIKDNSFCYEIHEYTASELLP